MKMYNAEFTAGSQKLGNAQISRGIFQVYSQFVPIVIYNNRNISDTDITVIFREVKNLITKKKSLETL